MKGVAPAGSPSSYGASSRTPSRKKDPRPSLPTPPTAAPPSPQPLRPCRCLRWGLLRGPRRMRPEAPLGALRPAGGERARIFRHRRAPRRRPCRGAPACCPATTTCATAPAGMARVASTTTRGRRHRRPTPPERRETPTRAQVARSRSGRASERAPRRFGARGWRRPCSASPPMVWARCRGWRKTRTALWCSRATQDGRPGPASLPAAATDGGGPTPCKPPIHGQTVPAALGCGGEKGRAKESRTADWSPLLPAPASRGASSSSTSACAGTSTSRGTSSAVCTTPCGSCSSATKSSAASGSCTLASRASTCTE
mmetsp:Transcript_28668/g.95150  ORF Transcript_28668/g.95150 Transcript_28668/m.95150 type:complete len:313 (+) Transcript_28668:655-1593(+)